MILPPSTAPPSDCTPPLMNTHQARYPALDRRDDRRRRCLPFGSTATAHQVRVSYHTTTTTTTTTAKNNMKKTKTTNQHMKHTKDNNNTSNSYQHSTINHCWSARHQGRLGADRQLLVSSLLSLLLLLLLLLLVLSLLVLLQTGAGLAPRERTAARPLICMDACMYACMCI